eukprot:Selendium_serpulae@DN2499_c0_g1_i4.p2
MLRLKAVLARQSQRLSRATNQLARGLYASDIHLQSELIQNADDNNYPSGVSPTVLFVIHKEGLAIFNNEEGFSADDLHALCDIGKSTKVDTANGPSAEEGGVGEKKKKKKKKYSALI